jgi:hypothetical protein
LYETYCAAWHSVIKLFIYVHFTNFCNKLECLSIQNAIIELLVELKLNGIGFVGHEETDSRDPIVWVGQVINFKLGCFCCIEHIVRHGIKL